MTVFLRFGAIAAHAPARTLISSHAYPPALHVRSSLANR